MADRLAAVLIVKNESAVLATCLQSLTNFVDVIHVYDTGSTDDTIEIAKSFGADVVEGEWTNDFAAARNAALANCTTEWVLSIDADETVVGDTEALSNFLLNAKADAYRVRIDVAHNEAPYEFPAVRLFRRNEAHWVGRIHEQIQAEMVDDVSRELVTISHSGYASPQQRAASASRNAELARAVIKDGVNPTEVARAYVDLGRSLIILGKAQDAADALEEVRTQYPNTREWLEATDFLTRLVLAEGMYEETLVLVQQLNEAGAEASYCDWLAAQAVVQLGKFDEADVLLANVKSVVDTSGRSHSQAALQELKRLVAQLRALKS